MVAYTHAVIGLFLQCAFSQMINLGALTFGEPTCTSIRGMDAADCKAAARALLDNNCISGVCNIPADPLGQVVALSEDHGSCSVSAAVFSGGLAATFDESPVNDVFSGFVDTCTQPGAATKGNLGFSRQFSLNKQSEWVILPVGEHTGG